MKFASTAEGFVLAGGRSTRMGRDKAFLPICGRPMIGIALDKLRALPLAFPPRICAVRPEVPGKPSLAGWGARPDLAPYAPVVEDIHPGCGPLSGIEAAFSATRQPLNIFLAVDLPLLPAGFLAWMLFRADITGALLTYPRIRGRPQPLCAVYHRELLTPIARALDAGERKVTSVLTAAAHEIAGTDPQAPQSIQAIRSIDAFDVELLAATYSELRLFSPLPPHRWFQNCNAPEDLAALETYAARNHDGSCRNSL